MRSDTKTLATFIFFIFLFISMTSLVSAGDINTCQDLSVENTVYNLTADVSSPTRCFNVTANNITLDGNGFTVYYSQGGNGEGIYIVDVNDTTVKDINFIMNNTGTSNSDAMEIERANGLTVQNVNITVGTDGTASGIAWFRGDNVLFENIWINMTEDFASGGDGITATVSGDSNNITFRDITIYEFSGSTSAFDLNDQGSCITNFTLDGLKVYGDNAGFMKGLNLVLDTPGCVLSVDISNIYIEEPGEYGILIGLHDLQDFDNPLANINISGGTTDPGDAPIYVLNGQPTLVNATYDFEKIGSSSDSLTRQWWVDILVDDGSSPVPGVNVTGTNTTGDVVFSVLTDANGLIHEAVTYYINDSNVTTYYNTDNITISAVIGGYDSDYAYDNYLLNNIGLTMSVAGTDSPLIALDYPTNNIYLNYTQNIPFNFTPTDTTGTDSCQLWGNWSTWHLNESWSGVVSGDQISTLKNISDGSYIWSVWCNDTTDLNAFSLDGNFTFTVDTIDPVIDPLDIDLNTTAGSQNVDINLTDYTEVNCDNSYYSIYKEAGGIENSLENISLTSCADLSDTFTVTAYAVYNLTWYMEDKAGNLGSTDLQFEVNASGVIIINTGGGGGSAGDDVTKIPVIGLKEFTSNKLYGKLEREIIFASLNSYCASKEGEEIALKDYSEDCQLTLGEVELINKDILQLGYEIDKDDIVEFYRSYKRGEYFQGFETEPIIEQYSLFTSVLGIVNPMKIEPASLRRPFIVFGTGENITIEHYFSVNKNIKECTVLEGQPDLNCIIVTNTTFKIIYHINDTRFFDKIFQGKIQITSDATAENLEIRTVPIAIQVYNLTGRVLGIPAWIFFGGILIVLIVIVVVMIGNKKFKRWVNGKG